MILLFENQVSREQKLEPEQFISGFSKVPYQNRNSILAHDTIWIPHISQGARRGMESGVIWNRRLSWHFSCFLLLRTTIPLPNCVRIWDIVYQLRGFIIMFAQSRSLFRPRKKPFPAIVSSPQVKELYTLNLKLWTLEHNPDSSQHYPSARLVWAR